MSYIAEEQGVEQDINTVEHLSTDLRDLLRFKNDTHPLKVPYTLALAGSFDFLTEDLNARLPDAVYGACLVRLTSMNVEINRLQKELEQADAENKMLSRQLDDAIDVIGSWDEKARGRFLYGDE